MKVLITGASGLIGTRLAKELAVRGHELLLTTREEPKDEQHIQWDAEKGFPHPEKLEGIGAVVHLAGEPITALRWTDEKKKAIRDSRVHGTRNVVAAISRLAHKPTVMIAGSAVGYYGERGDEELTEASNAGEGFLADVCREWESESRRAEDAGIRTVLIRTGLVLSKDGGVLGTMALPFKLGLGGVVGSGKQWMSWISLDDHIAAIIFALENESLRGAVNFTAPEPVTNEEFTKTMGEVLYRPTIIPVPEFAVSMLLGEMGDQLLLASMRVLPKRLEDNGFKFQHPSLKETLELEFK